MIHRLAPLVLALSVVLIPGCNATDDLFGDDDHGSPPPPAGASIYEGYDTNGVLASRGWLTPGRPGGDPAQNGAFHVEAAGTGIRTGQPIGDGTVVNLSSAPGFVVLRLESDFASNGPLPLEYWMLRGVEELEPVRGTWEWVVGGTVRGSGSFATRRVP